MNISEIKQAVDAGLPVKWASGAYDVIRDKLGQYLIVCNLNYHTIGLHGRRGTPHENVLNGEEGDFYIHTPTAAAGRAGEWARGRTGRRS